MQVGRTSRNVQQAACLNRCVIQRKEQEATNTLYLECNSVSCWALSSPSDNLHWLNNVRRFYCFTWSVKPLFPSKSVLWYLNRTYPIVIGQPNFPLHQWDLRKRSCHFTFATAGRVTGEVRNFLSSPDIFLWQQSRQTDARFLSSCPLLVRGGRY